MVMRVKCICCGNEKWVEGKNRETMTFCEKCFSPMTLQEVITNVKK